MTKDVAHCFHSASLNTPNPTHGIGTRCKRALKPRHNQFCLYMCITPCAGYTPLWAQFTAIEFWQFNEKPSSGLVFYPL